MPQTLLNRIIGSGKNTNQSLISFLETKLLIGIRILNRVNAVFSSVTDPGGSVTPSPFDLLEE